jgi:hypothetical protein
MRLSLVTFFYVVLLAPLAMASERPEHFEGKESASMAQALANLAQYNAQLQSLLEKESLTAQELYQVHQMTYTLENALAFIDSELDRSAEALENVHLASEANDAQTVREQAQLYLSTIRAVTGQSDDDQN